MKRVYIPWYKWECQANGMWRSSDSEIHLQQAIEFTGDHVRYGNAMLDVIFAWPNSMMNFLSNPSINKRAYLGHCAVCFEMGIPESVTRLAWKELTETQRNAADIIATLTLTEYFNEIKNRGIHSVVGIKMLR